MQNGALARSRAGVTKPDSVFFALRSLAGLLLLHLFSTNALAVGFCVQSNPTLTYQYAAQQCYESEAQTLSGIWDPSLIQPCTVKYNPPEANGGISGHWFYTYYYKSDNWGALGYGFAFGCSTWTDPSKNNGCPADGSCTGDPINAGTGNMYLQEEDYSGSRLHFRRYYNSDPSVTSDTLGNAWRHTYSRSVIYSSSDPTIARVLRENGKAITFALSNGQWSGELDIQDKLTEQTDASGNPTGWTYVRAGTLDTEQYDATGHLASIVDAHGFQTTLTYSTASTPSSIAPAPGYLLTVTDPFGRSLQFTYTTLPTFLATTGFLKTLTTPNGEIHQYAYDAGNFGNLASVTYAGVSTARTYVYNESAHTNGGSIPNALTGLVDENSARYGTFDFDANGYAVGTQHAGGADKFTLAYNSDGSSDVTDPQANVTHHTFVAANNMVLSSTLSSASVGFANAASRTYDSHNNPVAVTDFNGHTTCYTFDQANGLETARLEGVTGSCTGTPSGVKTVQTDWDTTQRVPTERRIYNASNTLETKTRFVYNSRRQVLSRCEIDPSVSSASSHTCGSATNAPTGVRQTTYAYCEQAGVTAGTCPVVGLVLSIDGPRTDVSDVTTYTYYQTTDLSGCATTGGACHYLGDLQKITNALGQVTTYVSYDKNGRVSRQQDANGTVTDMTYHPRGWLLTRTVRANADGSSNALLDATTTFNYDNAGNVKKITQPDGAYLSYTYDAAHRLTDIGDNLGNTLHYTLDAAGNRTKEETKDASSTLKRSLSRQYDQLSRLVKTLNATNATVQQSTNPVDAPPTGITYANGYDGNGNAIYSVDGLSVGTEQQYDPLNRLIKTLQDHAGTGATKDTTTQYTYDARDHLRSVTDPDGVVTGYTYDGLNNLTTLSSPDTGSSVYTYDAAGNRKTQTDARSVTSTYSYDALNRLTGIAYPTTSLNVTYAYDQANSVTGCATSYPLGRLTTITDSAGSTVYCYDRRGNITSKQQTVGSVTSTMSYSYTLGDRLATLTYASGAIVTYTRNVIGQITTVSYKANATATAQTLISAASYLPFGPLTQLTFGNGRSLTKTYNPDYAIDKITSSDNSGTTLDATVDVLGNLINASSSVGATPPTQTYSYDPLYRLTKVASPSKTLDSFTYNKTGDRLTETAGSSTQTYTYSSPLTSHRLQAVGSVTRSYDANGNLLTSDAGTFIYDDRNRLTALNAAATKRGTVQATYSYNGKGERVAKSVGKLGYKFTPTTFVYDESGKLMGEYSTSGNLEYLYLDSIPVGVTDGTTLYYIETDQLGTPREVIKPNANTARDTVEWKWDYFASDSVFGTNAPSPHKITFNLRFPGQYYDDETGLHYNYFRDYEPATGRYVESDPIGLRAGTNTYVYVGGRPLRSTDPAGLMSFGSSCDASQRMEIVTAYANLLVDLMRKACGNCDGSGPCMSCDKAESILSWLATSARISCNFRFPCALDAGSARSDNIDFYPGYASGRFYPKCGCLESTILHEADHQNHRLTGTASSNDTTEENNTRYETMKCVSCARRDYVQY